MMRAKMKVNSVEVHETGETLKMSPVCANSYPEDGSDENNTFARFTPSGSVELYVSNPDLAGKIRPGQEFFVDFTKVA